MFIRPCPSTRRPVASPGSAQISQLGALPRREMEDVAYDLGRGTNATGRFNLPGNQSL